MDALTKKQARDLWERFEREGPGRSLPIRAACDEAGIPSCAGTIYAALYAPGDFATPAEFDLFQWYASSVMQDLIRTGEVHLDWFYAEPARKGVRRFLKARKDPGLWCGSAETETALAEMRLPEGVAWLRELDYVLAARASGRRGVPILFCHIIPNVVHLGIINFSLGFIGAIKAEVTLTYLGLGVTGQPSWGQMISVAQMGLVVGRWWQITAASVAMFIIVLSLNIFGDRLRDALDPKLRTL